MSNINFDNPWLLLLAIPLAALVVVPFVLAVKKENADFHNITSLILHLVICACLTLVLAGMSFEKVITETDVYVLADVSYSTENNAAKVDEYVDRIYRQLPKNTKMGIICFGRDYQLLTDLGEKPVSVSQADVETDATDIASALRYAGNLFNDDVIKRIVIITDGAETVTASRMTRVVKALNDDGVYVDAVYLDDNLSADVREIQLDGVEYTTSSYLNKEESVDVLVRSNNEETTRGYVTLTCLSDGSVASVQTAESFHKGLNVVRLPLQNDRVGEFSYQVTVSTLDRNADTSPYNNRYSFSRQVTDIVNVLFIGGTEEDCLSGQKVYGTKDVDYVSDPDAVPVTVEELCRYDEIVLSNFDVRTMSTRQAFLSSLDVCVSQFGKTLTTYGNTYVQDTLREEDESLSSLSGLLPVNIGNKDQDTRLITIVLDISMSMNMSMRFDVAKSAAISLLEVFNDTDMVMVVGVSGDIQIMLSPTYLKNRATIIDAIDRCEARNGTVLSAGMQVAYDAILSRNFHNREMFIISDGRDGSDKASALALAESISEHNITLSSIAIYPDNRADSDFLQNLVYNEYATGKGYFKVVSSEDDVDFVVQDIAKEAAEVEISGSQYAVTIEDFKEEVVGDLTSLEKVNGFWYSSPKSSTTTVLSVRYFRDALTSFDVPLYAYWSYGKGKVASFLSDITTSSDWTTRWSEGSNGGTFLSQIAKATLPDENVDLPFIIRTETEGAQTTVNVEAATINSRATVTMQLTDPSGYVTEKTMAFDTEYYYATFDTPQVGHYVLKMNYQYGNDHYETEGFFDISYLAEYDAFHTYS